MKSQYLNMLHILNIIYKVIKTEYWPYRYYILLYILFITTFTWEMLTVTRLIRFFITCVVLIIYKKLYIYIYQNSFKTFNIKYLIVVMWINILQNPILHLVWKWDLYIYPKIKNMINKNYKNNYLNILFCNITIPLKILYAKFYMSLNMINKLTLKEFMFNRIYGLIISVLIFSDIIKYLLNITGGILYLIIYIYVTMYILHIIYIYYSLNKNIKNNYKTLNIKNYIGQTVIYKIYKSYIELLNIVEINNIYQNRVQASIISIFIKNFLININNINTIYLNNIIDKIPEQWRFWIYWNVNDLDKILYISYKDRLILAEIINSKVCSILNKESKLLNNNHTYYYETYIYAIYSLPQLFKIFENVLYYKYYVLKKGAKNEYKYNVLQNIIDINEYEYIYKMYLLILQNILFYIWSFEYFILKDKNNLTKLYIIEDVNLEYGYHIYPKPKANYNSYDIFKPIVTEKIFIKKYINEFEFSILKNYEVNEFIYILSKLIKFSDSNILIHIAFEQNKILKDINIKNKKNIDLININTADENDLYLLKDEIALDYFIELKNVMNTLYQKWELNNNNNIFKNNLFELVTHCNKKK